MSKFLLLVALSLQLLAFFEEDEMQSVLQVPQKVRPVTVTTVAPKRSTMPLTVMVPATVVSGEAISVAVRSEGEFVPKVSLYQFVHRGGVIGGLKNPMRTLQIQGLQAQLKLIDRQIAQAKQQQKHHKEMLRLGIMSEDAFLMASDALRQKELERTKIFNALSQQILLQKGEVIRAPEEGYITSLAPSGSYLTYGMQAASMNPTRIIVRLSVPFFYAMRLKPGQPIRLESSFANISAAITAVLPNSRSNLIDVIAKPEKNLPVGTELQAKLMIRNVEGWIIPKDAIVLVQNRPALFLIKKSKAILHFITVQKDMIDKVLVTGHLKTDDQIALKNAYMLHDGATVEVAK